MSIATAFSMSGSFNTGIFFFLYPRRPHQPFEQLIIPYNDLFEAIPRIGRATAFDRTSSLSLPHERERVVGREDANEMSVRVGGIKTRPPPDRRSAHSRCKASAFYYPGRRPKVAYAPSPPLRGGGEGGIRRKPGMAPKSACLD